MSELARRGADADVLLICAAGFGNFGDDAILSSWIEAYGEHPFQVVGGEQLRVLLGPERFACTLTDFLDGQWSPRRMRYIHVLGGGYLNDKFNIAGRFPMVLRRHLRWNTVLLGTGLSLVPMSDSHAKVIAKLPWHHLFVRDQASLQLLAAAGSRWASLRLDDTWAFPLSNFLNVREGSQPTLWACIQQQFGLEDPERFGITVDQVVELFRSSGRSRLVVLVAEPASDLELSRELRRRDVEHEVVTWHGLPLEPLQVSPLDGLVSTRFHPRLLFQRAGLPTAAIVIDDYYANKHLSTSEVFHASTVSIVGEPVQQPNLPAGHGPWRESAERYGAKVMHLWRSTVQAPPLRRSWNAARLAVRNAWMRKQ